jgi:hypothetical protein
MQEIILFNQIHLNPYFTFHLVNRFLREVLKIARGNQKKEAFMLKIRTKYLLVPVPSVKNKRIGKPFDGLLIFAYNNKIVFREYVVHLSSVLY